MTRVLAFNRRLQQFLDETGLEPDDVRGVGFLTDIDWKTGIMQLKDGRRLRLSRAARNLIHEELHTAGNLSWLV